MICLLSATLRPCGSHEGCALLHRAIACARTDHHYSATAFTDDAGNIVERYAYDAYGKRYVRDDGGVLKADQDGMQAYGFTGRRLDSESGLWYFRARYFDDQLGRFMGRDPVGYMDGYSLYRGWFVPGGVDSRGTSAYNGFTYECAHGCNGECVVRWINQVIDPLMPLPGPDDIPPTSSRVSGGQLSGDFGGVMNIAHKIPKAVDKEGNPCRGKKSAAVNPCQCHLFGKYLPSGKLELTAVCVDEAFNNPGNPDNPDLLPDFTPIPMPEGRGWLPPGVPDGADEDEWPVY